MNLPPSSAARTIPPDGLTFYREAEEGKSTVPWADYHPTPHLIGFWMQYRQQAAGKSALVAGCGLGAAAAQHARWGFCTTGFDISETAIRNARKRFPHSRVDYQTADLPHPPAPWRGQFDFVFETNTLQVLPAALRPEATRNIAAFLRPGGHLLLIARHREASDAEGEMPWPSRVRKFPPSPLTVSRKSCSTFFLMSASRTSAVFASFSAGRDLRAPPQCSAASTLRNAITAATNSSDFSIGGTCPHLSKVISFAPAIPAA